MCHETPLPKKFQPPLLNTMANTVKVHIRDTVTPQQHGVHHYRQFIGTQFTEV